MKKKKLILILVLGSLPFFISSSPDPGGHFVCDGIIPPGLSVNVTDTQICPGEEGSVEVDTTTSEGTMYGHYEDTGEQDSFGLSFTDVQVTEAQVFEAPAKYTTFWIKHDTINMSGSYEDCGGGTEKATDYDMGIVTLKVCDTKKPKGDHGPKGPQGPGNGGGGGGGGEDDDENGVGGGGGQEGSSDEECEEPAQPDQGVAEFMGGNAGWIVWPAPKPEWSSEDHLGSVWFVATHRIVTINTPAERDLTGVIRLNKISGDESCLNLLVVNDNTESPYTFGQDVPIEEKGHSGCGVHDWHEGSQLFGFVPLSAGEVVLEAVVDPNDGSPQSNAQLTITIVAMDLDIEHPATGEVTEENEEEEGLVAVKRDDDTPLTRLKLKPIEPSGIGGHYYLTFPGNLKIWQNENRTGAVTETTEFNPDVETTLYVEAMEKSTSLNDQQIALNWKEGEEKNISYGDWVKLTAVEAEFVVLLRAFIPDQWVDLPEILGVPFWGDRIDLGDDRDFLEIETMGVTYKAAQKLTIIPFEDLDEDGIKEETETSLVGKSTRYDKSESVPFPNQGYSVNNRLNDNAVITDGPIDGILGNQQVDLNNRPNDKTVTIELSGQAREGVFGYASLPVTWHTLLTINSVDPLEPRYSIEGVVTEFPAFEIYVRKNEETAYWIWGRKPPEASLPDLLMYTIEIIPNEWTDYVEGELY